MKHETARSATPRIHPDIITDAFIDTIRAHGVVVPLDGSARARRQSCPVRLVRVIPIREEMFAGHDPADRVQAAADDRSYAAYREEQMRALRMEACGLRAPDIAIVTELLTVSPAEAIPETLAPGDMLVLASHGEGGVRPWLLGHTAQQLIATATSPVVLVPVEERQAVTMAVRGEAPVTVQRTPIREQMPVSRLIQSVRARSTVPAHREATFR